MAASLERGCRLIAKRKRKESRGPKESSVDRQRHCFAVLGRLFPSRRRCDDDGRKELGVLEFRMNFEVPAVPAEQRAQFPGAGVR